MSNCTCRTYPWRSGANLARLHTLFARARAARPAAHLGRAVARTWVRGAPKRPPDDILLGKDPTRAYGIGWDRLPTASPSGVWLRFTRWSSGRPSGQPPPGSLRFDSSVGPPPFSGGNRLYGPTSTAEAFPARISAGAGISAVAAVTGTAYDADEVDGDEDGPP